MRVEDMTLEAYKQAIKDGLVKEVGKKEAERLMQEYEPDFNDFHKNGWRIGGAIAAIIMGW